MPTETLTTTAHSLNVMDLILGAGIIVQLVMLGLLLASIYSWYLIAKLNISFKHANKQDQQFEKVLWEKFCLEKKQTAPPGTLFERQICSSKKWNFRNKELIHVVRYKNEEIREK